MKKLFVSILTIYMFFSSIYFTNAGELDNILNIKYGVEKIEYKLANLPEKQFKNKTLQEKYNKVKILNKILTDVFYSEYKAGNINYYTTKGIIKNHKNFIYHTKKLFQYLKIKANNPKSFTIQREANEKIIYSYSEMRISYNKIIFLLKRAKKRQK